MALFSSSKGIGYGTYTGYGTQSKHRLLVVIGGGIALIAFFIIMFTVINMLTSGGKNDLILLTAREDNLYQFVYAQHSKIQNSDLRKINADARILTTNNVTLLHAELNKNYGITALPDAVVAQENDTASAAKLRDASLVNHFDFTYQMVVADKIARCLVLAQTVEQELGDSAAGRDVHSVVVNLQSLSQQLKGLAL